MKNLYNKILKEAINIMDFDSWDKSASQENSVFKNSITNKLKQSNIHIDFDNPENSTPELFTTICSYISNFHNRSEKIFDLFYKELIATDKIDEKQLYGGDALFDLCAHMVAANLSYQASRNITWHKLYNWLDKFKNLANQDDLKFKTDFAGPSWWMSLRPNEGEYIFLKHSGSIKTIKDVTDCYDTIYNFARLFATFDDAGTEACPDWMTNDMADYNINMNDTAIKYLAKIHKKSFVAMENIWLDVTDNLWTGDYQPIMWEFAKKYGYLLT